MIWLSLIIKVQHRSAQTVFWQARMRTRSDREQPDAPRLLLMEHEYLFIFRKPQRQERKGDDEAGDEKPLG